MFQKQDKMSLKKKSKSMGHLNIESPIFDNHHILPKKKSYPGEDFKSGVRTTPKKLKGLVRQRTNPMMMPVSVGKAIFSKANKTSSKPNPSLSEVFGSKENVLIPNRHRTFLMDTQVKFTVGLQCQERNLFLFDDLLIIAKERPGNQFKLKDQISLSDVWLANCLSEVSELTTDMLNSFVIGWPITNAIITFSSPNLKNLWWDKLSELIENERILAPSSTNIQVTYFDQSTNFEHVKSLCVTVRDDARACIQSALKSLELLGNRPPLVDVNCDYQLWVRTKSDEAPYPLIGHEIPLVIKLYWTRQAFINSRNQKTFDEYRAGCRCSFILRKTGQTYSTNGEDGLASKNKLKKVKSSMKLQRVFRRASKNNDIMDSGGGEGGKKFEGKVFGRNLEEVCVNDVLPYAIIVILKRILTDGPDTVGIFRRSPNARAMRELREKIDQNEKINFEECSVFVIAALLKDFLRSLPDCLLQCLKYDEWIRIGTEYENDKDLRPMKNLISNLPRINEITLRHLVYILKEIADKSKTNMMNASNLGICVGPSVLWCNDSKVMMEQNYSKDVSCLTKTLIEQYESLFGKETPSLFTTNINGEHPTSNIQTESTNGPDGNKMAFDNSSLESLLDHEDERMVISTTSASGATASGEGLSLNNLSHDSGLTTSDSQLFMFEGGENNSFSSDDFCTLSNKKMIYANKSKIHIPVPVSVSEFHHPSPSSKIPFRQKQQQQQNKIIHSETPIKIENSHRKILVSRVGNVNYIASSPLKIPLRRTASEESVSLTKSPEQSRKRRPVFHRKGKAPAPPSTIGIVGHSNGNGIGMSNNVTRSNSVNHNREGKNGSLWYRSCSATRLNSGTSSTCSTLTDEDSTPRVSRSNSYGKHENENCVEGTPMTIEIGNCNTPPGYEETISRQRILKGFHRSNSCLEGDFSSRGVVSVVDDDDEEEEEEEEEVIVDQDLDIESSSTSQQQQQQPPPLPPKTERPPLPPKQRQRGGVKIEDTYVNSEELRTNEEGFVYPQYSSGAVHVSTVSDNNNRSPGKTSPPAGNKKRSVTRIVATPTRTKSTRSVETQTEEKDFFSLYSSDSDSLEESEEEAARNLIDYTPHHRFQSDYYHQIPVNHYVDQRSLSPHRFSNSTNSTPDRRRIEPVNDPLIQGEINWSVSQLRSFFNQGQQKQNSIPVPQYSPHHHSHGSYNNYNIRSSNSGSGAGGASLIDQRRNNSNSNNNIICDVNMYSPKPEQDSDQESYV